MAQWNALRELVTKEKIKSTSLNIIYGHRMHFPVLFRQKYANWIESQEWPSRSTDDLSANMDEYQRKYEEFVNLLHADLSAMDPSMEKIDFNSVVEQFVDHFQGRYDEFAHVLGKILKTEENLILSSKEPSCDDHHRFEVAQDNSKITQANTALRSKLRNTEVDLNRLEEVQEKEMLAFQELKEKIAQQKKQLASDPEAKGRLAKLEKEFMESTQKLVQKRTDTMTSIYSACRELTLLLQMVWAELDSWRNDQRLACTMLQKPKEQIMEVLDRMGESVGEVFMTVLSQIDRLINLLEKVPFQNDSVLENVRDKLRPDILKFLNVHLERVFVVDKNIPKQVLKVTNGKSLGFSMSVRLLGGYAFGLNVNQPKVFVKLYPEKQINEVLASQKVPEGCCKIQNAQDKSFEFLRSGNCIANFNNMVVSNVKREGRGRNDDFVTDFKHAFVFCTKIKIMMGYCQKTEEINLKAISLPLVITSQTSQECMARGTIIWSAAFQKTPEERQLPFEAQEEVPWLKVSEVINALFKDIADRSLTKDHLNYLAKIAFRESHDLDFDKMNISRNAVLKDKLPKRDFPFWKWLMSCLNSVKDTLFSEWKEGLIYGFISKDEAENKLRGQNSGTFLIRFSESNIEQGQRADIHGYLTVAVTEVHPNNGTLSVFHVKESLTPKDLMEKKLAPILEAYETDDYTDSCATRRSKKLLHLLWTPNKLIPFEQAFGKYIKQKESMNDGYHRGRYLIKIYLADSSPHTDRQAFPMSPGSSLVAPSPAASDMTYSDVGSPMMEPMILPMLPSTISQSIQQVCMVPPMTSMSMDEPTLTTIANGIAPGGAMNFSNTPLTNGMQGINQLGADEIVTFFDSVNIGMEPGQTMSTVDTTQLLTLDKDDDVMLNTIASDPQVPQYAMLQNSLSMQQYQQ